MKFDMLDTKTLMEMYTEIEKFIEYIEKSKEI